MLVTGASMPPSPDLPDDLKALVRRHALQLSHERFRTDSERLVSAVERGFRESRGGERREGEEKERLEAEQTKRQGPDTQACKRAPWSGYYYVNIGDPKERSWNDA